MSLQQLSASWLTAKQETNLGLGVFNFDFSLIKVEPPQEFAGLGKEISPWRRTSAEEGEPHFTARKLGALFQHWLPRTPHLIRAYGMRASEIAASPDANPKASQPDGIFADHVGIDGTSIWAAATSGPDAIAVHLLACILARIWGRSEATAIWAELVAERKKELASIDETDPLCHMSRQLSKISINREHLKEWDNSARSWIQAADDAMRLQQTQLMLIVNNLPLPVNQHPKLFQNVLQTWKSAMIAADNLIQGMPQSVEDASVLLGLCSWHIYPDMLVLQDSTVQVTQDDRLVNSGGLLTVGLEMREKKHEGVYWSLPLGHLRYYGEPVKTETSLEVHKGRVSIMQLVQVAFGSLSAIWGYDRVDLASFFIDLWDYLKDPNMINHYNFQHSLGLFAAALRPLREGTKIQRKESEQLMRLGSVRCKSFLSGEDIPPVLGLASMPALLNMLSVEDCIDYLRQYMSSIPDRARRLYIIRTRVGDDIEFATACEMRPKREAGANAPLAIHGRWIDRYSIDTRFDEVTRKGEFANEYHQDDVKLSISDLKKEWRFYWMHPHDDWAEHTRNIPDKDGKPQKVVKFTFVLGTMEKVSLWVSETSARNPDTQVDGSVFLDVLSSMVRNKRLNTSALLQHLEQVLERNKSFYTALRSLATVFKVYTALPEAKVSLEATSKPLHLMEWIPKSQRLIRSNSPRVAIATWGLRKGTQFTFQLDRKRTFSCITLFESGIFSVSPSALQNVVAMASSGSIYISAPLSSDPAARRSPSDILRIRGSIGKPGIALLIPAQDPRVSTFDKSDWQIVNHETYDGREEDSFKATTMHLFFTEYILPIDTGKHGTRDFEIYFQESLISIHDHGRWVADIDLLAQLERSDIFTVAGQCQHLSHEPFRENSRITSIDSFTELIDSPEYVGIVRAKGNWLGRLATAGLSIQLNRHTIVLPGKFCWSCLEDTWLEHRIDHQADETHNNRSGSEDGMDSDESDSDLQVPLWSKSVSRPMDTQRKRPGKRPFQDQSDEGEKDESEEPLQMDIRFDATDSENDPSDFDEDINVIPTEYYVASGSRSEKLKKKKRRAWAFMVTGEKLADMANLTVIV